MEAGSKEGLVDVNSFEPCSGFQGARPGWAFKRGQWGVGYYRDVPLKEPAEAPPRQRQEHDGVVRPQLQRCHYEVLGVAREAHEDELRQAQVAERAQHQTGWEGEKAALLAAHGEELGALRRAEGAAAEELAAEHGWFLPRQFDNVRDRLPRLSAAFRSLPRPSTASTAFHTRPRTDRGTFAAAAADR